MRDGRAHICLFLLIFFLLNMRVYCFLFVVVMYFNILDGKRKIEEKYLSIIKIRIFLNIFIQ